MKHILIAVFVLTSTAGLSAEPSPRLLITRPVDRAIFQRDERGIAKIPLSVTTIDGDADTIEVRAVDRLAGSLVRDWVAARPETALALPSGWYRLEFRARKAGREVAVGSVEHVGVGEVFVTCGQSNSANYGSPRQTAKDDRVSSGNFETGLWAHSDDPQPGATGAGGSPWPLLGDLLVEKHDVPVGFVCVGVGSTTVAYWTPSGKGYVRLRRALQLVGSYGCRAVLWHQGESDSINGTSAESYATALETTIAQSRKDAGWDVPWGVALAAFHPKPEATAERQAAVVTGQKRVAASVPDVFQGPETDSFHTRGMLSDSVHFNGRGLAEHAQGWATILTPLLNEDSRKQPVRDTPR